MGIVAFCPNGHRIKVKDRFAGKKGICPTCQSRFRIPHRQLQASPGGRPGDALGLPAARAVAFDPQVIATLPAVRASTAAHDVGEPEPGRVSTEPDVDVAEAEADLSPAVADTGHGGGRHALLDERPDLAWCVAERGGAPSAPLETAEIRAWLESGAATSDHVVWRADWPDWRPLEQVFPDAVGRRPRGRP